MNKIDKNKLKEEIKKLEGRELQILIYIIQKGKEMIRTLMQQFDRDYKDILNLYMKLSKINVLIFNNTTSGKGINEYSILKPDPNLDNDILTWIVNQGYEQGDKNTSE